MALLTITKMPAFCALAKRTPSPSTQSGVIMTSGLRAITSLITWTTCDEEYEV